MNLGAEISLIDTRIAEIEKRIDVDGGGALWRSLGGIVVALESALDAEDMEGIAAITDTLRSTIQRAQTDQKAWEDITQLIEQRRKLVESEAKRRVQMQDMITSEKAMLLVAQLTDSVRRHVRDPVALAGIAADFGAIVTRDDPATP